MEHNIPEQKKALRSQLCPRNNKIMEKEAKSHKIMETFFQLPEYQAASTVCIYVSFEGEVMTTELIKKALAESKRVIVPVSSINNEPLLSEIFFFEELVNKEKNILEPLTIRPVEMSLLDLVIVPGIAFDEKGNRLGRGGGYYDKLLSNLACPLIALAFEEQIQSSVPIEKHDIRMNRIVTEERIILGSGIIIQGKKVAAEVLQEIKSKAAELKVRPALAVILVGDNPASKTYVTKKSKVFSDLGFYSKKILFTHNTREEDIVNSINTLNDDPTINGILVQLPLPDHLDAQRIIEKISPKKDVDGLHPLNVGKLQMASPSDIPFHVSSGVSSNIPFPISHSKYHSNLLFVSCTPLGVFYLFKKRKISIAGKNVVIVGRSNIVGKPLVQLFLQENATVTICHSKTDNLSNYTLRADILVVAVGVPRMVRADMVKKGAVVIDVGITRADGKLVGDVDFNSVREVAGFITPVPGGVGPMTISMLVYNTFLAALKQRGNHESR